MIYIDILILAMIAIFILNRLRSVLGKKTGNEPDFVERITTRKDTSSETKPDLEINTKKTSKDLPIDYKENSSLNEKLNYIKQKDKTFNLKTFLDGAKKAFEYIIDSYINNNEKELSKLLSGQILGEYKKEIKKRTKSNEKLEIEIIELKEPIIKNVETNGNNARIHVEYKSQQIQVTKNKNDEIIEGDLNQILSIKEIWIFSKKLNSKSPIWALEEILDV